LAACKHASVPTSSMKATLAVFLLVLSLCLGSSLAADRTLAFALKQRNLDALERLFWQRTDPTHADYAKYVAFAGPWLTNSYYS
jgi:hypothetical protein